MNTQRKLIYSERRQLLEGEDIRDVVEGMLEETLDAVLALYIDENTYPEQWDMGALAEAVKRQFDLQVSWTKEQIEGLTLALLKDELLERVRAAYRAKEAQVGPDMMRYLERMILLQSALRIISVLGAAAGLVSFRSPLETVRFERVVTALCERRAPGISRGA